jgi:hypothetical protein
MESSAGFFLGNGEWKPIAAIAGSEVARRSARVAPAMDLERKIMIYNSLWRRGGRHPVYNQRIRAERDSEAMNAKED